MSSKGKDEVPQPTANKKVLNDNQQKSSNQRGKHVLEAQKSSQASSNTKGLQPEIANRIRVSFFNQFCYSNIHHQWLRNFYYDCAQKTIKII